MLKRRPLPLVRSHAGQIDRPKLVPCFVYVRKKDGQNVNRNSFLGLDAKLLTYVNSV